MGEYKFQKKLSWAAGISALASVVFFPAIVFTAAVVVGKYMRRADAKKNEEFLKEKEAAKKEKKSTLEDFLGRGYSPVNSIDKAIYNFYVGRAERQKAQNGLEKYLADMPDNLKKYVNKVSLNFKNSFFGIPYNERLVFS